MKIATIMINPAIDMTITLESLKPGSVNRAKATRSDPGGKAVNVASFLADRGLDVTVTGFLGADNQESFVRLFANKGIRDEFIRVDGETRVNVKLVDETNQKTTDVNSAGNPPTLEQELALITKVTELCSKIDVFVLSGNIHAKTSIDIYAKLISVIKQRGKMVVLDTSGKAFAAAISTAPDIIKPNEIELSEYVGHPIYTHDEIIKSARDLLDKGIGMVIVSMGGDGALFVTPTEVVLAVPPKVEVKSTVAAGDAMVAGLIASKALGYSLSETAKWASAFSLRIVTDLSRDLRDESLIRSFAEKVKVKVL